MATLDIQRDHTLGLVGARTVAERWMAAARDEFGMRCDCTPGAESDTVHFSRSGVNGTLQVSGTGFRLQAQLGFLLGAFKDRIEGEIGQQLDQLLGQVEAVPPPSRQGDQAPD